MKKILLLGIMILLIVSFAMADDSVGANNEYRMDGKNLNRDNWDGQPISSSVTGTIYSPTLTNQFYGYAPTIHNGIIYVNTANGFTRLNASDISQPIIDSYSGWSVATTSRPIVANGYIYQTGRGSTTAEIRQFSLSNIASPIHTGTCSYDLPNAYYRDPIVYNVSGNMYAYCFRPTNSYLGVTLIPEPGVYRYDADDVSSLLGFTNIGTTDIPLTRGAGANGYLYFGGAEYSLVQINATTLSGVSIPGSTTAFYAGQSTGPVVYNGHVYYTDRNNIYRADENDIVLTSAVKTLTNYGNGAINALAIDNGYLYASVSANQLSTNPGALYQLDPTNLSTIANYTNEDLDSGFGAPVVDNGVVYVMFYNGSTNKLLELHANNISRVHRTHELGDVTTSVSLTDDYVYGWANQTNLFQIERTDICIENWIYGETECINNSRTIIYTDTNACGTTYNLPSDNGTTTGCIIGGGGGTNWPEPEETTTEEPTIITEEETPLFDYKGLYEDFSLLFQKLFEGKLEFKEVTATTGNYLLEIFLVLIAFALLILGATSKKKDKKKKGRKRK